MANHHSPSSCRPASTIIRKLDKYGTGRLLWRHCPEYCDDWKESKDVKGCKDAFGEREVLGAINVKKTNSNGRGNNKKSCLPALRDIVWVCNDDETLNNSADYITVYGDNALP